MLAGLLHWLLSEAIFYQEIAFIEGEQSFASAAPGSFPIAGRGTYLNVEPLFVLVIFAAFCMLAVVGLGFRRYAGGIPIVCSNSRAIATACLPPRTERGADALMPIRWGVRGPNVDGIADIGFSSDQVDPLDPALLCYNAAERALRRFKSGFNIRVASRLQWRGRWRERWTGTQHQTTESTDGILMGQSRAQPKSSDGFNSSYAPLDITYDPGWQPSR